MSPQSIIGHKKQLLQLTQDLETNNIAHAYLFAGAPHLGKTTVAHWFARQLLTRDAKPEDREEILRRINHLLHPDFLVLDQLWMEEKCEDFEYIAQSSNIPQQHRAKAGIKTDAITIDDVREIQHRLQETGETPARACIIRGIERMHEAASSALLKILEEPPEGCVFLLTSDNLATVLPTVFSRSRVMRFERVGDRDIQTMLKDTVEEDASFILHLAQGAPGIALRLMDDPDALRAEKLLHTQAMSFWGASSLLERLKQLETLHERGEEAERFLMHLALALREIPEFSRSQERALMELIQSLKTNAHRQLLAQNFAMSIS